MSSSSPLRYGSPICGGTCENHTQTFPGNLSHEFYYMILCSMNVSTFGRFKSIAQIVAIVTILICLVGLVGNGSVIWLLGFHIERNPVSVYILNLAIADFGTLVFMSAGLILWIIKSSFELSDQIVNVPLQILANLYYFTYTVSLYLLTTIGVARCLLILFPLWVRCQRARNLSAIISCLFWSVAALFNAMQFLVYCFFPVETWITVVKIISGINLLTFVPVMIVSTMILFTKVCCRLQKYHPGRLYTVIFATLLFFVIAAVPIKILFFVAIFVENIPSLIIPVVVMFTSVNSSVNPIIYYFVGRHRKHRTWESVRVVFQRVFKHDADSAGNQTVFPNQ